MSALRAPSSITTVACISSHSLSWRLFAYSPQSLENGQFNVTMFGEINVVAPGRGNNLWSPILSHVTFDANGNPTSSTFDPFPEPTCH